MPMLVVEAVCGRLAWSHSALMVGSQVAYFVNSGSEANDMALLMARLYTRECSCLLGY